VSITKRVHMDQALARRPKTITLQTADKPSRCDTGAEEVEFGLEKDVALGSKLSYGVRKLKEGVPDLGRANTNNAQHLKPLITLL
jgi:hypothetical protein